LRRGIDSSGMRLKPALAQKSAGKYCVPDCNILVIQIKIRYEIYA